MDPTPLGLGKPLESIYILGVKNWFWMPFKDESMRRAIAVDAAAGKLWIAGYTFLLILTFLGISRLLIRF